MKPAPFDYLRAGTVQEAQAALAAEGEGARVIAGGQSLVAMLNMRLARPTLLVDVMHVAGGAEIRVERGQLVVPFAVRQAALLNRRDLLSEVPLLAAALPWVGHVQTRARGTVCGSVAHADPSAEIALALVALDGRVHLRGRGARRLRERRTTANVYAGRSPEVCGVRRSQRAAAASLESPSPICEQVTCRAWA